MTDSRRQGPDEEDELGNLLIALVRTVVKCFYQPKDLALVDLVIKEGRVTEKMVETALLFDQRLTRLSLATLKNDRILSVKTEKDKNSDEKVVRMDYFFIKYGQLVNVIKYKLDNVRSRLETLEREANKAKSFQCCGCGKAWTDLEAGELFNLKTSTFRCTMCGKRVKEDVSGIPKDTRELIIKFNQQTTPIYDILRKIDEMT